MGLGEKIKLGEIIPVLLEKIEDRNGEVLVSANKAQKLEDGISLLKLMKKMSQLWARSPQNVRVDVL